MYVYVDMWVNMYVYVFVCICMYVSIYMHKYMQIVNEVYTMYHSESRNPLLTDMIICSNIFLSVK